MMTRWARWISTVGSARVLRALGGLFVALAVMRVFVITGGGRSFSDAALGGLLIGSLGLLLLYGGYRLPDTELHPDAYPRIVAWTLGGFGVMLVIMGLLELAPTGGSIDRPLFAIPLGTGLGSVGGLAVGVNEAKAISRAREVEQRNQELKRTQAELRETVGRLETSNERLEQFAYAASHDLQEPVRMVTSYLQLIERRSDDELTEETREFLAFAVDGAERMRVMIDALLQYSQVERQGSPFEPVELDNVFAEVCDDLQVRIEESDAEITAESLPRVEGDGRQLRQVFQNLVDNAIEYSGDDPPQVHVFAEQRSTNPEEWLIAVRDEGIGIDPSDADRVFEVFQRLHTHDEHAGTGIGLALCKRIVERHGGEMWVEAELGEGSTFYFTLPADEVREPRAPEKSQSVT